MAPAPVDTRSTILHEARRLLLVEGMEGLSMRKLGTACGLTAPALYRHFSGKDEILSRIVETGARLFISYLTEALREPTPLARLHKMGQMYLKFAEENPADYDVLFTQDCDRLGLPLLDQAARDESSASFQLLVDRIIECQQLGLIAEGSPVELAVFVWSSLHGLVSLGAAGRLGPAPAKERLADQQLELILAALRPC